MKMNMNKIQSNMLRSFSIALFLALPIGMSAQEEITEEVAPRPQRPAKQEVNYEMREVCGRVLDAATNQPIDGARVQAYGQPLFSAMTDDEGTYWLKVPVFVNSLYVTVPGFNDVQVAFGNDQRVPDVLMYSSKFNAVYQPKTNITASKIAEIDMASSTTIDGEIEGKLAGDIHTINRTGLQGQGIAMFIRGINSLNLNAQPLVILDGMFIDMQLDRTSIHDGFFNNILAGLDPEDIESVEVLKNATAIYGARGANGVVIINTKRGRSMATKINVNIFGGFETAPDYTKMMNGSQYKNYVSELIGTTEFGIKNPSAATTIPFLNDYPNYYWYPMYHNNTDWSDGLYRTAFTQNYKVNVQGGDDAAMYNLSLGYTKANSTAKENDFSRLNIRFNTDINLFKNLSTQLDVAYSRINYDLRDNGWAENYDASSISSPNVLGLIQAPFLSKYGFYTGEDLKLHQSKVFAGKYVNDDNYPFGFASRYGNNAALANPYWILKNGEGVNKNNQQVTQFNLNVMPKWEINKHLVLTNRFAYQLNRSSEKYYLPEAGIPVYNLEGMGDITSIIKSFFGKETSVLNDFRINWSNQYGAHSISAFGGFRFTNNSYSDNFITAYNSGNDKMPDVKNSLQFRSTDGNDDSWRNLAYYINADYNYKNTYFVNAAVSAESSSRFGHETSEGLKLFGVKWGIFPSLQLGWVITNESWMNKLKGVNYLKLTLGYDESGNDAIPYSSSRTYFQSTEFLKTAIALKLVNIENPEIQWETTRRFNAGLNGSFFNNRIQAGIDLFLSTTSNLLTLKENNYMTGLGAYWTNDGKLQNMGADVHVNAIVVNTKDFKWELGASIGHYKNKIKDLPSGDYTTKVYGAEVLTAEGKPAGLFYGYKTEGVFSTTADANEAGLKYPTGIKATPYKDFQAGDVHFVDMKKDGVIDSNDKTVIGDPNPDIYGNIFTTFGYKRFTLAFNFKYSLGNDIYNYQRSQLESLNGFYNQTIAGVNRWRNEGDVTDMPRACATTSDLWVNNERFSDRWIEDGSYLKLKKVRISYDWPLNLSWIQGMTLWAEANNLFTISKYTGTDPEFSCGNGVLFQGIDAGLLPVNRSFNLGVRINL
jgi:TonB-linked SusC/RagA family outer membrane protein